MDRDQGNMEIKIDGPNTDASHSESILCGSGLLKGGVSENTHKVPRFYRQDVVRHKKNCSIGIVNDVAGDSDSDSSVGDFDDEDNNEEGGDKCSGQVDDKMNDSDTRFGENYSVNNLPADQVRILWLDNSEEILNVDDLVLVDRGFLHGDYVASALEPTGQVGVVQDVDIVVDLLAPDGSILKEVSSKVLKRVREFSVGDYVVYGPWLGRVDDVFDNVTVQLDDGSSCRVLGADPLRLKSVSNNNLDEDSQFPYYPGQRVKATSSSVFKNSKWLSGFWKANKLEGTVAKVTVGFVIVYWIASAGYGPDSSTAPSEKQSPKNLKLLSCFAHASWQLGDYCMVPSSVVKVSSTQGDVASKVENIDQDEANHCQDSMDIDQLDENHEQSKASLESSSCCSSTSGVKDSGVEKWPLHRKKMRRVVVRKDKKSRRNDESFEKAYMIVNTRTRIDVAWQNGTIERSMDSKLLIPIDSPGDHEFVAEQYVVEKASDETDTTNESRRCGVIQSVNAKEKTAKVRWLKTVERSDDPREFDVEEIVSVYELEGHPDYDYTYGDVVVRLSPITSFDSSITDDNSVVDTHNNCENGTETTSEKQNLGSLVNPSTELSYDPLYVSWVGNITGLKNGDIEVTWADGMVSTVGPQAIFVVDRDDDVDDESIAGGSDVSDGGASWETVNDEIDSLGKLNEEESVVGNNDERNVELDDENSVRNRLFPLAVIDFVGKLAGIFSRKKMIEHGTSEQHENSPGNAELGEDFRDDRCTIIHETRSKENGADGEVTVKSESSLTSDGENVEVTLIVDCNTQFKRFDTAQNPLDHHFLVSINQVANSRKWLKKVQQDWNILQNNLPDGIYVRVYEDRMDLIRAVMVGAYGTPYQDGLFFFDFFLPSDYPDVPPSAHYHSGGWRINPNLYEEGKVCLSLLNTWTGRGNEVWDPKSSSILQVLVSLQGLVLNSRPYFNEAGYDKQVGTAEGEKNSLSYNENTFLLNCKTMMFLIRRPPKDFEDLIKEHFCKRGKFILMACDAYMKGTLIGSLNKDANASVANGENSTSVGFKLMLAKIMPKLYAALTNIGADCADFNHLLPSG